MSQRVCLGLFAGILLLTWFCYSASFGADFQLDDKSNLGGLAAVSDQQSAIDFIVSGEAGPTGRPLALATFALQAEQWQIGPDAFLRINILIHLCNALLIAFCLHQVLRLAGHPRQSATIAACVAASVWVSLPLLATSTLLVVQRMTTLSALIMLFGLAAYLLIRARIEVRPLAKMIAMGAILALATVLAAFSKESALLLPALVLVLETTVLTKPASVNTQYWRIWRTVVLGIPLVAVLSYLAMRVPYPEYLVERRGFDAAERLLTQAQILWLYLSKAVFGLPARLGIYHEDVTVIRSVLQPAASVAVLAWIAVVATALHWRRNYPWYAFAVLWFVVGHLVESTVMPLELYFEHRNYVPMIGPSAALAVFLLTHSKITVRAAKLALPLFLLMNVWFLYGFASIHANPDVAARYWVAQNPNSVRAVTNLVTRQLSNESVQSGMQTLDAFLDANPRFSYLRIQQLNVACLLNSQAPDNGSVARVTAVLHEVDFTYTAASMLSELSTTVFRRNCVSVSPSHLLQLAGALANNRRYANDPKYQAAHATLLASIKRQMGKHADVQQHLDEALSVWPTPERIMMMTMAKVEVGKFEEAQRFLDEMRAIAPKFPLKALRWERNIDDLQRYVSAAASQE